MARRSRYDGSAPYCTCGRCGATKPTDEFYRRHFPYDTNRVLLWCKECCRARQRERYVSDPDAGRRVPRAV